MRIVRRIGIGLLLLACSLTACAEGLVAATDRTGLSPRQLSAGPFARADGVLTRYQCWGSRRARRAPIVLVHGFVEATWVWAPVARRLGARHRVCALDLRGFGYSQRLGPYTADAQAAQIHAFAAALGLRRPVLVGHSLGAAGIAQVARRWPRSVGGVVFVDGDGRSGGAGPGTLVRQLLIDPFATGLIRVILGSDWIVRQIAEQAYGVRHPPLTHALLERWRRPFRVIGSERALIAMAHHPIPGLTDAQLRQVEVPAALIWGADDGNVPLSDGRAAARDLGGAPITVIAHAGHLALLTDPGPVARAIERFARRLPRRSR